MNKAQEIAMIAAWNKWHNDIDGECIPSVNVSYFKGFQAALDYTAQAVDSFNKKHRPVNDVINKTKSAIS